MTEDRYSPPGLGDTERLDGETARSDKAEYTQPAAPTQNMNNSGTQEGNFNPNGSQPESTDFNAQGDSSQPESTGFNAQTNGSQPESTGFSAQADSSQPESTGFNAQANGSQPESTGFSAQADSSQPEGTGFNAQTNDSQPESTGFSAQSDSSQPEGTGFSAQESHSQGQRPSIDYDYPAHRSFYTHSPAQYAEYAAQNPQHHGYAAGFQPQSAGQTPPAGAPSGASTNMPNGAQGYRQSPPSQQASGEYTQGGYGAYPYGAAPGSYYYQSRQNAAPHSPYVNGQPPHAAVNPYFPAIPQPPYGAQAKEKKSGNLTAGVIIFLAAAAVVLALCVGLTVALSLNSQSGYQNDGDYSIFSAPDNGDYDYYDYYDDYDSFNQIEEEAQDVLDESDVLDTTDENGPQIELEAQPDDIFTNEAYTAKNAYDKARQSVVGIVAYNDLECSEIASQGTGIVISENGYIVTNSHVIDDSRTRYMVRVIIDNTEYDAQVTGFDSRTDIAVLKIDETGLTPAEFADSDELEVGQSVVAIGNPGGVSFSNSITQGIVSALDRDVDHGSATYIQTDAAINPGNSGGPLLNMDGQVVGITTVKIVTTGYEGMGFAIPSKQAQSVIDSIIRHGYVEGRVRIGVTGTEITSYYSSYYDMPMGIYVASIDEDGPLADTELEVGDIITKINEVEITSFSSLYKELDKYRPGDVVTLTCKYPVDENGTQYEEYTIDVTLQEDASSK